MTFLRSRQVDDFNVTIQLHILPGYCLFLNFQLTPTNEIIFGVNCLCGAAIYTIVSLPILSIIFRDRCKLYGKGFTILGNMIRIPASPRISIKTPEDVEKPAIPPISDTICGTNKLATQALAHLLNIHQAILEHDHEELQLARETISLRKIFGPTGWGFTAIMVDYHAKTITNEYYRSDIRRTFRMTEWLLTPLGLWLLISRNPTRNNIYTSIVVVIVCMMTLMWVILPCTRHLAFLEKDRNIRVTKIGPVSYCYKSVMLYSAIILSTKRIRRCIEHIKSDWRDLESEDDRQIMIKNLAFSRKITIICGIFMYTGGLSYHSIMQLWSGSKINSLNETIRPHVYPGYDDFVDSQATPAYELIFTAHFITALVACNITTASCNLTATFVGHALGQIQIVMTRIRKIVDEDEKRNSDPQQRIASAIRGHVSALRLTAEIEKVLRNVCLVEVFGSTFVMCTVEYYFIKEWSNSDSIVLLTYVALFFSLSFNIFLFCQIGEILMGKCYGIGKLTYGIPWYNLSSKAVLPLILIIAVSHCQRRLSAGGLLGLSMNSFATVMRTSLAYLNLLYTMDS